MLSNETIQYWLKRIVRDLVDKNYKKLEKEGLLKNFTAEDLKAEIQDYPGTMTLPPVEFFNKFRRYDYEVPGDEIAGIEFTLWFDGEESDLTLLLDFFEVDEGIYYPKIYDLHVL
jgi:hypothetical protein